MIRTPTGEVRLVWRLILVLVLFVAVEVLLRVIPIGLIAASMVKAGTAQASAVKVRERSKIRSGPRALACLSESWDF
jgi:hypothetical protein